MFKTIPIAFTVALLLWGSCTEVIKPPENGSDTTSHNISWEIDSLGSGLSYVKGVWASDSSNAYAVGNFNIQGGPLYSLAHWDGVAWTYEAPPILTGSNGLGYGDLSDVYGVHANSVWVAGTARHSDPWKPDTSWGMVVKWNGLEWIDMKIPAPLEPLMAIFVISETDVWVSSNQGSIFHYDGLTWTRDTLSGSFVLWDLFATSSSEVYASGGNDFMNGIVLRNNGNEWKEVDLASFSSKATYSFWGSSSGLLVHASYTGIQWFKENEWKAIQEFQPNELALRVRGTANNDVWLTGRDGLLAHYNGNTWKRYQSEFENSNSWILRDMHITSSHLFVAGSSGSDFGALGLVLRGQRQ